ncbi:MAG: Flp family type IVb pilin [Chloroflexota bacterium]|nr:Flp family type IVb pilin [Chloroflexota bacterium]
MTHLLFVLAERLRQMRGDERGQGLTEYALLLVAIAGIVAAAIVLLGGEINAIIDSIFV